jgi:hypothetical protein
MAGRPSSVPLVQWCQAGRLRNVAVTHLIEILAIVLGLITAALSGELGTDGG